MIRYEELKAAVKRKSTTRYIFRSIVPTNLSHHIKSHQHDNNASNRHVRTQCSVTGFSLTTDLLPFFIVRTFACCAAVSTCFTLATKGLSSSPLSISTFTPGCTHHRSTFDDLAFLLLLDGVVFVIDVRREAKSRSCEYRITRSVFSLILSLSLSLSLSSPILSSLIAPLISNDTPRARARARVIQNPATEMSYSKSSKRERESYSKSSKSLRKINNPRET